MTGLLILPRSGEVAGVSLTEGAVGTNLCSVSSPSVAYGATSPLRGSISEDQPPKPRPPKPPPNPPREITELRVWTRAGARAVVGVNASEPTRMRPVT